MPGEGERAGHALFEQRSWQQNIDKPKTEKSTSRSRDYWIGTLTDKILTRGCSGSRVTSHLCVWSSVSLFSVSFRQTCTKTYALLWVQP